MPIYEINCQNNVVRYTFRYNCFAITQNKVRQSSPEQGRRGYECKLISARSFLFFSLFLLMVYSRLSGELIPLKRESYEPSYIFIKKPSVEGIEKKREIFRKKLTKTKHLKNTTYFLGTAAACGLSWYVYKNYFKDETKSDTKNSSKKDQEKKLFNPQEEIFIKNWWEQEKQERTTLFGGIKRGLREGVNIAVVSLVSGLLLKMFDLFTHGMLSSLKNLFKTTARSLFDHTNNIIVSDINQLKSELVGYICNMKMLQNDRSDDASKIMKINCFSFDLEHIFGSFVYHMEELIAISLEIISDYKQDKQLEYEVEKSGSQMCQDIIEFSGYLEKLINSKDIIEEKQTEQNITIQIKMLLSSTQRYINFCDYVLLGEK
jgi:hypothetical protein